MDLMQHIVTKIHSLLIKKQKTLAVAESCTGGLASKLLTDLPGSSAYFLLGVVSYSNKTKQGILGIPQALISKRGAVSKQVAAGMAASVRRLAGADFAIGITGIAGPQGGSPQKPTGTVFIAVESRKKKICKKFHFTGKRTAVRNKAALKALELLEMLL